MTNRQLGILAALAVVWGGSFLFIKVLIGDGVEPAGVSAGRTVLGVLTLAAFAFLVALCSESDAFVAASFTAFSDTAKLAFLVVGPAMDVKLATMEAGTFGGAFARQFVPVVIGTAILSAVVIGWWLL